MITRMQGLKRKMETLHDEEKSLQQASRKRLQHLQDLYHIPSLADVKYDEWSRIRLNRLLVEYLVRNGYSDSAKLLAKEKGIEDLVDLEVHARCYSISQRLRKKSLDECLAWCNEHKVMMRKIDDNGLEFELRLQQYIELCRRGKRAEAIDHARKHLTSQWEGQRKKVSEAAILLVQASAFDPVLGPRQLPALVRRLHLITCIIAPLTVHRDGTRNLAGIILQTSSSKPTINSSPFRPGHSS